MEGDVYQQNNQTSTIIIPNTPLFFNSYTIGDSLQVNATSLMLFVNPLINKMNHVLQLHVITMFLFFLPIV